MLTSYSSTLLGVSNYSYPVGHIDTNTVVTKGTRALFVNPSPLINRGDRKRPNAYSFVKTQVDSPKGYIMRATQGFGTQTTSGSLSANFGVDPLLVTLTPEVNETDVRNKALAKLYKKIKDSDINVSVTLGEGRETLHLLRAVGLSAAGTLTGLKTALKRGRMPEKKLQSLLRLAGYPVAMGLKNPLQTVGGFQLLWSLALRPLIADVENYRNHEASKSDVGVEMHFDARATSASKRQRDNISIGGGKSRSETLSESTRVEFGVNLKINDMPSFEDWRIGATVRPSLGWELATLSFLCDYFVNIGQYIELQEAALLNNGLSLVHGYQTVTSLVESTVHESYTYSGYDYVDSHSWNSAKTVATKNRGVLNAFPAPYGVTVKLPKAATPLLNIAALLSQLIVRR